MTDESKVETFLTDFKTKAKIWGVLFLDRPKNSQALADLEITPNRREKMLYDLQLEDYCDGPLEESQLGGKEMWVFGKEIKNQEIYIKITLGRENESAICISFHIAEHPMNFKFKTQ